MYRGSNVIGMWMRIYGMCFQYGGQSSLRAKTVSIVLLIIYICIDTATSRISRFGGKSCPVYIHTQYMSSKWVFQKLLSKFHRKNRRCPQNVTDHSCWHAVFTLYWTLFISFTSYYYKVLNCRINSLQLGPEESSVLIFQSSKLILRSSLVCEVNNR